MPVVPFSKGGAPSKAMISPGEMPDQTSLMMALSIMHQRGAFRKQALSKPTTPSSDSQAPLGEEDVQSLPPTARESLGVSGGSR